MSDLAHDRIYRHATYAPLVGSSFHTERPDGGRVAIELTEATVLPGRGECFSLLFRGPADGPLDQRTYRLEHQTLGEFPLFLVPVGPAADGAPQLEAVVNRLEG